MVEIDAPETVHLFFVVNKVIKIQIIIIAP